MKSFQGCSLNKEDDYLVFVVQHIENKKNPLKRKSSELSFECSLLPVYDALIHDDVQVVEEGCGVNIVCWTGNYTHSVVQSVLSVLIATVPLNPMKRD